MLSTTRKGFAFSLLLTCLVSAGCGRVRCAAVASEPKTEEEKVFYALGMEFGKRVVSLSMSPAELEMLKAGLSDGVTKQASKVDLEKIRLASSELTGKRRKASAEEEKKKGMAVLEMVAKEPGSRRLPAGLVVKTLRPGAGANPGATDIVKVNYEGRLLDGTVFESSYKENKPTEVGLLAVMSCWQIGIPAMKVGEKAQLVCPSEFAYGDEGIPPGIAGGATLVFDIELLGAKPLDPAPEVSPPRPIPPGGL